MSPEPLNPRPVPNPDLPPDRLSGRRNIPDWIGPKISQSCPPDILKTVDQRLTAASLSCLLLRVQIVTKLPLKNLELPLGHEHCSDTLAIPRRTEREQLNPRPAVLKAVQRKVWVEVQVEAQS